ALSLDPTFVPAYVNLADHYRALEQDERGEELLRQGVARVPRAAALHHALGLLLVRRGRTAEALVQLGRAAGPGPGRAPRAVRSRRGPALDGRRSACAGRTGGRARAPSRRPRPSRGAHHDQPRPRRSRGGPRLRSQARTGRAGASRGSSALGRARSPGPLTSARVIL